MDQSREKNKGRFKKLFKRYSNLIYLILLIGVTTVIILTQIDPITFINTLQQTKIGFLLIGIGCVFFYWILEAYMLLRLMRRENPEERFSFAFTLTMVGQYYNRIDPGSTGGQPIQLYELSKKGYGLGAGTAVLVQKYALYQVTITFLAIFSIIFCLTELNRSLDAAKWLIVIGITLNVAAVIFIFILILKPESAKKIISGCVKLLLKLRILKNPEKYFKKVDHFVGEYKTAIGILKSHKKETLQFFLISIVQTLIFYSVNYFIYLSLGLSGTNAITIISLQAILYVAVAFIPTPGSAGGAEACFLLIFGPVFGPGYTAVAMIIWRIITFYFILLFGGIYLSLHSIKTGKEKYEGSENDQSDQVERILIDKDEK